MAKKNTEIFIAKAISKRNGVEKNSVMVKIATLSVAISIAVMIISLAIIFGFKKEITSKISGFSPEIAIINFDAQRGLSTPPIPLDSALQQNISSLNHVTAVTGYASGNGVVSSKDTIEGIMLKGVGEHYDWTFFNSILQQGKLPEIDSKQTRKKEVIISQSLSKRIGAKLDGFIEVVFMGEHPKTDTYKIIGIYDSGFEELDKLVVMTDMRNVQRLYGWESDMVSGYEVRIDNFENLDAVKDVVRRVVSRKNIERGEDTQTPVLAISSVDNRFANIFDWLKAHDVNATVIITIMLLVALLNMITALLIILLERVKMIGILKALGMQNVAIQKIFVARSAYIVVKGMIWGNVIGIGLSLLQKHSELVKLDASGYALTAVPIELGVGWIVGLNVAMFCVIILTMFIPTMVVTKISPDSTMRYHT